MAGTVQEWAERALFGSSLADKLTVWPTGLDPDIGSALGRVTAPGRPPELALPIGERVIRASRTHDLRDDRDRARLLHELANHELQAIELFALALLRWPDAPAGLRRGLAATLADEQRHLRAYLDRLAAVGGTVGEWPVSRSFWDVLEPVDRIDAFLAGMALCFESANLDFCEHWRDRFEAAGDPDTARVLTEVRDDEIRHVAHGLVWFGRTVDGDRLDAWARLLPPPLTPARARGPRFDAESRERAGFSSAEIERLRLMGGSRGRLARVLWFDAGLEDALANGRPSARADRVTADLSVLPMFLAHAEDVVVAPHPSVDHLARLADAGFPVPRFVSSLDDLRGEPLHRLEPWGPGPHVRAPKLDVKEPLAAWHPTWRALSSKTETLRRALHFEGRAGVVAPLGRVWSTVEDPGAGPWVLKAPFSTSGGSRLLGEGPLSAAHHRWLAKHLRAGREVVWQPWWPRWFDLSAHVTVTDHGVRIDGLTRFATTATGGFAGTWLGPWWVGLPPDQLRALHQAGLPPRTIGELVEEAARAAGTWAHELGFRGQLSIDAAVVGTPDGPRVHPWLETNARRTLGRVGLALGRTIGPSAMGWWRVARATPAHREALAAALRERPAVVREGRWISGVLATTEPERAVELLTWIDLDVA